MFNLNRFISIAIIALFPLAPIGAEEPPLPAAKAEAPPIAAAISPVSANADPTTEGAPVQQPKVYKWTDAQGKTYYGDIRPHQVPDATTVPHVKAGSKERMPSGLTSTATDPAVPENPPSEADTKALLERLNTLLNQLNAQLDEKNGQNNSPVLTTDSETGSTTTITVEQKPQVYKWTDAQGKIHYSNIQTNSTPNPTVVPIMTPASSSENSEDLTGRFNAMANELTERRLAPFRMQQELFQADLKRTYQKEAWEAEKSAAEARARALELERDIQREAYAEQERQREKDRRERRHERQHGHMGHYRPVPPPKARPAPPAEPPRPVWKPKEIPPFHPKEVGLSR